jgi:metal-dependent HD superfamily phosphatase/phosphodiesterase
MLDTLEVAKNLLDIVVVLAGSIHDLGHRVDRDVEQLVDQLDDDILVRDIGHRR